MSEGKIKKQMRNKLLSLIHGNSSYWQTNDIDNAIQEVLDEAKKEIDLTEEVRVLSKYLFQEKHFDWCHDFNAYMDLLRKYGMFAKNDVGIGGVGPPSSIIPTTIESLMFRILEVQQKHVAKWFIGEKKNE
jgi:hypothetical protein